MDYRLTIEDLGWLRKLRDAKVANQPLHDIPPTGVLRKLAMLGCAQLKGRGEYSIHAQRPRRAARQGTGEPDRLSLHTGCSATIGRLQAPRFSFCGA